MKLCIQGLTRSIWLLTFATIAACGGGTEPIASPPTPFIMASVASPVKKATTVSGGNGVVIHMYQALYGMAPSNALLLDYAFQANNDAAVFVRNLTDRFATTSHSELAKIVLDNLGVTAATVPAINAKGEGEYALLLDAVKQIFGVFPTMRGQVILNMTNLLVGLEGDSTYGGAAIAYNKQAANNFSNTATYSVPTDLSKITYPHSYQTPTTLASDVNTNPCNLDLSVVTYPQSWTGKYPYPVIKGAPFPPNFYGGISLKDIMLADNPTFNPNCVGNLNSEFDRTIVRLVNLNVKYVKVPQWHWIQVNQDGSWSVVKAENSFGPLPDANLSYFVAAAHKAGLKVILDNQIQGINNPVTGYSYEPDSNSENYAKWFSAFKAFLHDRAPYFQSIGIDVWELGCSACLFHNVGTASSTDLAYFAAQTKSLIPIVKNVFRGALLIGSNPWLLGEVEVIDSVDYITFGIYDVGWGRISAANANDYSVQTATAAFMSDQLNPGNMSNYDKLGKTLVFDATLQSRANVFTMPGYLEETGCTSSIGNLNISATSCLQKETIPDFSAQAIFFEALFESLSSLNLVSNIVPLPMNYWETDSMISTDVFPSLGSTIRNKPAEGIVKAWFAK
jgi:hypothetical protein